MSNNLIKGVKIGEEIYSVDYESLANKPGKVKMLKITLIKSGWDKDNLTQTVNVEGVSEDETKQAIYISTINNKDMMDEVSDCGVYACDQGANSITFICNEVPSIDIDFYIKLENVEVGNNDAWIGFNAPVAAGSNSDDSNFVVDHSGGLIYAVWSGSIPNLATPVTALGTATCVAIPDPNYFYDAVTNANTWVAEMNSLIQKTYWVASDLKTRYLSIENFTVSNAEYDTTSGKSNSIQNEFGDETLVSCTVKVNYKNPGTTSQSGYTTNDEGDVIPIETTAHPSGSGSYTISVEYNFMPHVLCGPSCS